MAEAETKTMKFAEGENGKFARKDHVTMFNANIVSCDENGIKYGTTPDWKPFGEDNEEIVRSMNNEIEAKQNILGKTNIDHKSGAETTEIDPIAIRKNDVLSYVLYLMFKYNLTGDKAKLECMEVTYADKDADGNYGAFRESAIVDLKSWGGDTTKINSPITLNWLGDRDHGKFSTTTKAFTSNTTPTE